MLLCVLISALLSLAVQVSLAAIGPVTNLTIANRIIAPDGYSRSYVISLSPSAPYSYFPRAVLAGGQLPGPLIVGQKVSESSKKLHFTLRSA